jgi:anti-sigma factor RsiW
MKPDPARDGTYYRASDALRSRVGSSLKDVARERSAPSFRHGLLLAASFATVALVSWGVALLTFSPTRDEDVTRDVVAAHVRSLMTPGHLNDVASSDQHTVKPWFSGRLDFAPPVRDLAAAGFPLTGGRLDYIDGRPVATLTYQRRLHVVTLFEWPATSPTDTKPVATTLKGYSIAHWTRGAMQHWAVSDAAPGEITAFAEAMQQ